MNKVGDTENVNEVPQYPLQQKMFILRTVRKTPETLTITELHFKGFQGK